MSLFCTHPTVQGEQERGIIACSAQLPVPQYQHLSESNAGEAKTSSLSIWEINVLLRVAWDAGDPDNLNFHCQCSSSFIKCFSVLTQLLKCETCACDSAIK